MTKIDDSELKDVSGGGDQAQSGGPGGIQAEVNMDQGGSSGDEDDQDTTVGQTGGGQQNLV